jgi:hypothetical protein
MINILLFRHFIFQFFYTFTDDDVLYLYAYYALINEGMAEIQLLDDNSPTGTLDGGYYFKYLKYKYKYNQLKLQIK